MEKKVYELGFFGDLIRESVDPYQLAAGFQTAWVLRSLGVKISTNYSAMHVWKLIYDFLHTDNLRAVDAVMQSYEHESDGCGRLKVEGAPANRCECLSEFVGRFCIWFGPASHRDVPHV